MIGVQAGEGAQSAVKGAEALVQTLANCGLTHVFANPGTSELDLVLALDREPRIQAVSVLFEGVASGAADGFARLSGRPAATLLHLGPGYLNACGNLHNARRARSPIVNLVGDHAISHRRFDTPLNSDLETILAPQSAWVAKPESAADMGRLAAEAVGAALRLRGQASLIAPADAAWSAGGRAHGPVPIDPPRAPQDAAIQAAVDGLRKATAPVILVGGAALNEAGLRACAQLSSAGYRVLHETFPARMARGEGVYCPERLTYFTEMGLAQLGPCDLLILVGAKEPISYFAYPDKPTKHAPPSALVVELASKDESESLAIEALAAALGKDPAPGAAFAAPPAPSGPLNAVAMGLSIARALPTDAIISDDGVTASQAVFALTQNARRHDWLCLTGGSLGQGMPLAIGAALAAPGRKTLCITGDGAMLYTIQALWTMARLQLDIVTVVAVNRSYEILRIELARMGAADAGPKAQGLLDLGTPNIDYCDLARGFGVPARRCASAEEFDAALQDAFARPGPHLIEAILS